MRRFCVTVTCFVLALFCAGCGDSAPEAGPVEFKAAPPSDAILKLRDQMGQNVKSGSTTKKPAPDSKAADTKTADKKK
jgi:hypothetical protein